MNRLENNEGTAFEYIIAVKDYSIEKNSVSFNCITNGQTQMTIRIFVLEDSVIRIVGGIENDVVKDKSELIVNENFTLSMLFPNIEYNENNILINTQKLHIKIDLNPWNISFVDKQGNTILSESSKDVNPVDKMRAKPLGFSVDDNSKDVTAFNESFIMKAGEHFYGLGEKFIEFDRRGQKIVSWNRDALGVRNEVAYKNIPFFMSTAGYGLFVDSGAAVEFDMGHFSNQSLTISVPGKKIDYYFIYGPDIKDILYRYTELTGNAPVPPLWSFGLWMSTGFFGANRESVENCANKIREENIPCDVMHFDCFWLRDNMWCDFEWDNQNYPDTEEMIKGLKANGYRICLWINPYVSERSEMFREGEINGYFLRNKDGTVLVRDMWHGLYPVCGIIDVTNPSAVDWFKEKLRKLLRSGIDVFKTDFGEDIPEEAVFNNGQTGWEMHNLYALFYNRIVFEVTGEFHSKPMVWARSGYAGSQRYPACWSGDPACTFEAMAAVLRGGLSYGMSGVPFWSHDIGGFHGTPTKELFVRWAQFGLFSSHSRCHGTTTREPWAFGEEAENIFRKYAKLRYELLPYIYSTAIQCSKTALPFIRPLVLIHQDDPTTYHIDDQYYFGDDFLVAPVFSETNRRHIYLPKGEWVDYCSLEVYKGEQWLEYDAPLDILPLFVRKGAVIPVQSKEAAFTDENLLEKDIVLEVYHKQSTFCRIYKEDGIEDIHINIMDGKAEIVDQGLKNKYKARLKL